LEVKLRGAKLQQANIQNAYLRKADLRNADLTNAILEGADLREANLRESVINANLQDANLEDADLLFADFSSAIGLTADQIQKAKNWKLAKYNPALIKTLEFRQDHNDRIHNKNFSGYVLTEAYLVEADFRYVTLNDAFLKRANLFGADLRGAKLQGTNFQEADLRDILFVGYKQFSEVETLYQAKLDNNLMTQLKNKYHCLFKKPVQ
jgi:uncharacterized protein YjbI with pentapeptide repeats